MYNWFSQQARQNDALYINLLFLFANREFRMKSSNSTFIKPVVFLFCICFFLSSLCIMITLNSAALS